MWTVLVALILMAAPHIATAQNKPVTVTVEKYGLTEKGGKPIKLQPKGSFMPREEFVGKSQAEQARIVYNWLNGLTAAVNQISLAQKSYSLEKDSSAIEIPQPATPPPAPTAAQPCCCGGGDTISNVNKAYGGNAFVIGKGKAKGSSFSLNLFKKVRKSNTVSVFRFPVATGVGLGWRYVNRKDTSGLSSRDNLLRSMGWELQIGGGGLKYGSKNLLIGFALDKTKYFLNITDNLPLYLGLQAQGRYGWILAGSQVDTLGLNSSEMTTGATPQPIVRNWHDELIRVSHPVTGFGEYSFLFKATSEWKDLGFGIGMGFMSRDNVEEQKHQTRFIAGIDLYLEQNYQFHWEFGKKYSQLSVRMAFGG